MLDSAPISPKFNLITACEQVLDYLGREMSKQLTENLLNTGFTIHHRLPELSDEQMTAVTDLIMLAQEHAKTTQGPTRAPALQYLTIARAEISPPGNANPPKACIALSLNRSELGNERINPNRIVPLMDMLKKNLFPLQDYMSRKWEKLESGSYRLTVLEKPPRNDVAQEFTAKAGKIFIDACKEYLRQHEVKYDYRSLEATKTQPARHELTLNEEILDGALEIVGLRRQDLGLFTLRANSQGRENPGTRNPP